MSLRTVDACGAGYHLARYDAADEAPWDLGIDEVEKELSSVKAAKFVARFGAIPVGTKIAYPTAPNGEIFTWFAENRGDRGMRGSGGKAVVNYTQVLKELAGEGESHKLVDSTRNDGGGGREVGQNQVLQQYKRIRLY